MGAIQQLLQKVRAKIMEGEKANSMTEDDLENFTTRKLD